MTLSILALVALSAAFSAPVQVPDLQSLLSGKDTPLQLKLKDLNADWKHATIVTGERSAGKNDSMKQLMQLGMMGQQDKGKGASDMAGAMAAMSLLGGLFGGGAEEAAPVYYTQGKTLSLGGETFLVTYRLVAKAPNLLQMAAESQKEGGKEPDLSKMAAASKPSGESSVSLTLINMRSITTIGDLRDFDLNREIAESANGGGLMDLLGMSSLQEHRSDAPAPEGHTLPTTPAGESAAAVRIREVLRKDPQLSARGNSLEVETSVNRVVLKGKVSTASLKTRAENLARRAAREAGASVAISNQILVRQAK